MQFDYRFLLSPRLLYPFFTSLNSRIEFQVNKKKRCVEPGELFRIFTVPLLMTELQNRKKKQQETAYRKSIKPAHTKNSKYTRF